MGQVQLCTYQQYHLILHTERGNRPMKKIILLGISLSLFLLVAGCTKQDTAQIVSHSSVNPSDQSTSLPITEDTIEDTSKEELGTMDNTKKLGLTINETYYALPIALQDLLDDGWQISSKTPYFLPMVTDDYYSARTNLSLSIDGTAICYGGAIIRLLEKDGSLLEVEIANQLTSENRKEFQKIEDGVVKSIAVFYDDTKTSIQLDGIELKDLSREQLFASYPKKDGWSHAPSNFRNHPEFGVSSYHHITRAIGNAIQAIDIYFNLENTAFEIMISNEVPLKSYAK